MTSRPQAALDDLLVLELGDEGTQYCGRLLADLGARVIKIEPPRGAGARHRGPFKDDKPDPNNSLYFWAYNTSKESLTLDLTVPADREKLRQLARKADIVLEDYKPGYLESIGLGYPQLSKLNPGLIMTSITPFGQTGPRKDWKGGDLVHWASGSILAKSGYLDTSPIYPQGDISWIVGGHHGMMGALVALAVRDAGGEGQHVDVSIQEACANVNRAAVTEDINYNMDAHTFPPRGGVGGGMDNAIKCKDGKYIFASVNVSQPDRWKQLVGWFEKNGEGKEFWGTDLNTMRERNPGVRQVIRWPGVLQTLRDIAAKTPSAEMWPVGQEIGFSWMAYNAPDELLEDEQLNFRGFFQEVYHPEHDASYTYPGEPYKFSTAGWKIRSSPPLLGEHNAALGELLR